MDIPELINELDTLRHRLFQDPAIVDAIAGIEDIPTRNKVLLRRMELYNTVDKLINLQLQEYADAFEALDPMIREGITIINDKAAALQDAADALALAAALGSLAATLSAFAV